MKIFISHSSHDKWVARQMSALLQNAGHHTFLDEKDIKTGDSIDASIQQHLKDSDHLLLLLSPASVKSHWVFIELGGAKALGKRVVPVLFHVGANEIPSAISQLLARDINDFDKYIDEIKVPKKTVKQAAKRTTKSGKDSIPPKKAAKEVEFPVLLEGTFGNFSVGDKVVIAQVERLTTEDKDQPPKWVDAMDKYSGVRTTITGFFPSGDIVRLAADDGEHWWSVSWISKDA